MDNALVVLSGGQDSTTVLFWAVRWFKNVRAITFNYGQRHSIEIQAAIKIASMAGIREHNVVPIGPVLQGRSPLVAKDVELERYQSFEQMTGVIGDRVELTFVPMRNALFMMLAANYAVCHDTYNMALGVCQADTANYPDCRQSYVWSAENCINLALGLDRLGRKFSVHTPLMNMSKAQSIKLAMTLPGCMEALAYSHTAYDGSYPPKGDDHASILRAQGFSEAGVPDPLIVRAFREGLMDLPQTVNYAGVTK